MTEKIVHVSGETMLVPILCRNHNNKILLIIDINKRRTIMSIDAPPHYCFDFDIALCIRSTTHLRDGYFEVSNVIYALAYLEISYRLLSVYILNIAHHKIRSM